VASALVAVVMLAIGFAPLFGGPGYEHALASGLVVPVAAAIAAALETAGARRAGAASGAASPRASAPRAASPLGALSSGVRSGAALAGVALGTAFLHAARAGACDLWGGALHFALTAGAGALLGGAWGACAGWLGAAAGRPRTAAVLLAIAGPLASALVSVARFYTSPMIFAFDPFVGYFSGTLYDTVIDAGPSLLTYRLASAVTLGGAALVASALDARSPLGVGVRARPDGRGRLALGAALLAASAASNAWGSELGWWHTSSTIAAALGGRTSGPRCDVVYPSTSPPADAALMLQDCEEELASVEKALGARGPERVTALFFRDAGEKRRLMGAASTYIAKPWRREVYLQVAPYPHPVLGHELAHVVAGAFARGPVAVGGGSWPNPGLIEGVAVAASPDDDELTDVQWTAAMLDAGILPSLEGIFSLEFLGGSSARSYTVAGAFVRWLSATRGTAAVRAWYAGAPVERATGASLASLEAEFREHLRATALPPAAKAYATARFTRPGLFARRCPHVVDALRVEADACRDARQNDRAVTLYDRVLARDPADPGARLGRGLAMARAGGEGRAALARMAAAEDTPQTWRDRAEETVADLDAQSGHAAEAEAAYRAIAARTLDEDAARTLEVKAYGMATAEGRAAVEALLLGTPERPGDLVVAMARLAALRPVDAPLADYLLGKNLAQRAAFADARAHLERVKAPPTARVAREVLRQRAIVACATGDRAALKALAGELEAPLSPYAGTAGGRRAAVARLLERCAR